MNKKILLSKQAIKFLEKQNKDNQERIKNGIKDIPLGDIKPMQGEEKGIYRLRIGDYRIIFKKDIDNNLMIIEVIKIGNRGDVYKWK